jgi:hypothetical protein
MQQRAQVLVLRPRQLLCEDACQLFSGWDPFDTKHFTLDKFLNFSVIHVYVSGPIRCNRMCASESVDRLSLFSSTVSGPTPKSVTIISFSHCTCNAQRFSATDSAAVVELVTIGCLLDLQYKGCPQYSTTIPEVLLLVWLQPAKSESLYPIIAYCFSLQFEQSYRRTISFVVFK